MKICVLIIIIHLFTAIAFAEDSNGKNTVSIAIGFGGNITSFDANKTELKQTNTSYSVLGLKYKGLTLEGTLPSADTKENKDKYVDSEINSYGIGYSWNDQFKSDVFYRKTEKFYNESSGTIYKLENLGIENYGTTLYYLTHKDHTSLALDPIVYHKMNSNSSTIYSLKYIKSKFYSLEDLKMLPTLNGLTDIKKVDIDSIQVQLSYSKNAFWEHIFLAGAFGVGYTHNLQKETYLDLSEKNKSVGQANSLITLGAGYIWTQLTMGMYFKLYSWNFDVDKYEFTSKTGAGALYLSYKF